MKNGVSGDPTVFDSAQTAAAVAVYNGERMPPFIRQRNLPCD